METIFRQFIFCRNRFKGKRLRIADISAYRQSFPIEKS